MLIYAYICVCACVCVCVHACAFERVRIYTHNIPQFMLVIVNQITACCRVLQSVAKCCIVLQGVAVRCIVLQCVVLCCSTVVAMAVKVQYIEAGLQCIAFFAVFCSLLQCVAVPW